MIQFAQEFSDGVQAGSIDSASGNPDTRSQNILKINTRYTIQSLTPVSSLLIMFCFNCC